MSSTTAALRQRMTASTKKAPIRSSPNGSSTHDDPDVVRVARSVLGSSQLGYKLALGIVTILAFATRFYGLGHPDQVVFDEVHFGKFASYVSSFTGPFPNHNTLDVEGQYLQRTYFFDVHPPLGKLLFALMGWFVGYDGHFLFDNIGDSYIDNKVPYVAFRAMPALLGALTVSTVFLIMWESDYSLPACVLAAGMVLFDNAHIGQTRLILLDATLVFAMALSVLCYVRFYKLRRDPFGRKWWKWLLLTGVSLSCVISTKMVGVFTFLTIGSVVAIDLWGLLDVNRRQGTLPLIEFGKHFGARLFSLIVVPFLFYLFWFQVHFAILNRSGPGDDFMTPEFQQTLSDNAMSMKAVNLNYYDPITLRHKETKAYLHSHPDRYPLRYDDGRVSSQGQQVTGYPHNDTNNYWQIIPEKPYADGDTLGHPVRNGAVVQLRHLGTNTILMSHDVASPYYPTNQEFTTASLDEARTNRLNDTLFEIKIEHGKPDQVFTTVASHFKLIHQPTKVAMWTHTTPLPDWAYKQQEINGNKNLAQSSNIWYVEDVTSIPADDPRLHKEPRKVKSVPFLKKYLELQRAMFFHNNALTSSHPYASQPFHWPFLLRGVSFWTNNTSKQQIYFLGNPIGWWLASSILAIFLGIVAADQLSLRRGLDVLDERARSRLYNSTGFFFLTWAAHYLPFYLMGRQLFLHHYLPSHLASCLVTGALFEFIFNVDGVGLDEDGGATTSHSNHVVVDGKDKRKGDIVRAARSDGRPRRGQLGQQSLLVMWIATAVILSVVIGSWAYFAPLTYGKPALTVKQVLARKWLGYDLHFAK